MLLPSENFSCTGLLLSRGYFLCLYGAVIYSIYNLLSQLTEASLRHSSTIITVFGRLLYLRLLLGQISGQLGYFCYQSALWCLLRSAVICQLDC